MFNRHQNTEHQDKFPLGFNPWNKYDALVMRDVKEGTKVKHATGRISNVLANFNTVFDGSSPDNIKKGSIYYLSNVTDELNKASSSLSGDVHKQINADFYSKLSDVTNSLSSRIVKSMSLSSPFIDTKVFDHGKDITPITNSTEVREGIDGGYMKDVITSFLKTIGIQADESLLEMFTLLPQVGHNHATELVTKIFDGKIDSSTDRMMTLQYGEKALEIAKTNYLKSLIGTVEDIYKRGKKLYVERATKDKLEDGLSINKSDAIDTFDNHKKHLESNYVLFDEFNKGLLLNKYAQYINLSDGTETVTYSEYSGGVYEKSTKVDGSENTADEYEVAKKIDKIEVGYVDEITVPSNPIFTTKEGDSFDFSSDPIKHGNRPSNPIYINSLASVYGELRGLPELSNHPVFQSEVSESDSAISVAQSPVTYLDEQTQVTIFSYSDLDEVGSTTLVSSAEDTVYEGVINTSIIKYSDEYGLDKASDVKYSENLSLVESVIDAMYTDLSDIEEVIVRKENQFSDELGGDLADVVRYTGTTHYEESELIKNHYESDLSRLDLFRHVVYKKETENISFDRLDKKIETSIGDINHIEEFKYSTVGEVREGRLDSAKVSNNGLIVEGFDTPESDDTVDVKIEDYLEIVGNGRDIDVSVKSTDRSTAVSDSLHVQIDNNVQSSREVYEYVETEDLSSFHLPEGTDRITVLSSTVANSSDSQVQTELQEVQNFNKVGNHLTTDVYKQEVSAKDDKDNYVELLYSSSFTQEKEDRELTVEVSETGGLREEDIHVTINEPSVQVKKDTDGDVDVLGFSLFEVYEKTLKTAIEYLEPTSYSISEHEVQVGGLDSYYTEESKDVSTTENPEFGDNHSEPVDTTIYWQDYSYYVHKEVDTSINRSNLFLLHQLEEDVENTRTDVASKEVGEEDTTIMEIVVPSLNEVSEDMSVEYLDSLLYGNDLDVSVGKGDLSLRETVSFEVYVDVSELSDTYSEEEINVETPSLSTTSEHNLDTVIESVELSKESLLDSVVELDAQDESTTVSSNDVKVEVPELSVTSFEPESEVDLTGTERGSSYPESDVVVDGTDLAIESNTFNDVVMDNYDQPTKSRRRSMSINEEGQSTKFTRDSIDIFDEIVSDSSKDTIMSIEEDEDTKNGMSQVMDIVSDESSNKATESVMSIEEDNVSYAGNVSNIDISDDEESSKHKVESISIEGEEGFDKDQVGSISIDDDDDLGVGLQPPEPPWEEPTEKGKVWLIMGKQYPAWNGWNPKKTR